MVALVALGAGVGIGATIAAPDSEIREVTVPGEIPQDELDALRSSQAEVAERGADLDDREAALDERSSELDEREAEISATEEEIAANTVGDGTWTVGVDLEPGTYRAQDVSSDCYWAISASGSNGSDLLENDIPGGGNPTVTLAEGQDFQSRRCGEWTRQ
ncbi:hypothetical protein [Saccharomonospora iraqiensis]|uniref:hypothetical protein n=1 Tax=Saccharomonospora iraqiensis TaxID=52698 RepID=UPI0003F770E6|nr:hypothetical protein [Saccharomonospora iraqiensis]